MGFKAKFINTRARKKLRKTFLENELNILRKYFDSKFYLEKYGDVRESGFEPMFHFLIYGEAEGRQPTSNFLPLEFQQAYMYGEKVRSPFLIFCRLLQEQSLRKTSTNAKSRVIASGGSKIIDIVMKKKIAHGINDRVRPQISHKESFQPEEVGEVHFSWLSESLNEK